MSSSTSPSSSTKSFSPFTTRPFVELKPILDEQGNITFEYHAKTYLIKSVKQKVGANDETTIDLDYFKKNEKEMTHLIEGAKKAIDAMNSLANRPEGLAGAHSFTLHFSQKQSSPSMGQALLGEYLGFESWKWTPESINLDVISYKETSTSPDKKFKIQLDTYEKTSQAEIRSAFQELARAVYTAANQVLANTKPLKFEPKKNPVPSSPILNLDESDSEERLKKNSRSTQDLILNSSSSEADSE